MASQWPAHLNRECPRDPHFKATGWPRWPPRRLVLPLTQPGRAGPPAPTRGQMPPGRLADFRLCPEHQQLP